MSLLTFADLLAVKYTRWLEMDTIDEEQSSRAVEITVGLVASLPPMKYHHGPLQFLSKPLATAREYERRLLETRQHHENLLEDDIITIRCPNGPKGEPRIFKITRNALSRSAVFQAFFDSEYYAPNTNMLISFSHYPAAAFDIIKRYLEEGPDRFDMTTLRVYLYRRYTTHQRVTLLVRLCGMSFNMDLFYLHDMSSDILTDASSSVTAKMLPLLAGFIFASGANYHTHVKDWCLVQVGRHFLELKESPDWKKVLVKCEQILNTEWGRMLEQNNDLLYSLENHSDDRILAKRIHRMSLQEQDRVITVLGEHITHDQSMLKRSATSDEVVLSPLHKLRRNEDEDWSDVDTPSTGLKVDSDTDDRTINGDTDARSSFSRSNDDETAKARHLLGMNHPEQAPPQGKKQRRSKKMIASILGSPKSTGQKSPSSVGFE